jgi:hypothetical protein
MDVALLADGVGVLTDPVGLDREGLRRPLLADRFG